MLVVGGGGEEGLLVLHGGGVVLLEGERDGERDAGELVLERRGRLDCVPVTITFSVTALEKI